MTPHRGDADQPGSIAAKQLSAEHIGTLIRYRVEDDESERVSIITAELRQLSINQVHVNVIVGVGAENQHALHHDDRVILRPAEDYSDVAGLLGNDPEYAQFGRR